MEQVFGRNEGLVSITMSDDGDRIIDEINALDGREQEHVPWLLGLLTHNDDAVRYAALRTVIHECDVPTLPERLWPMLDNEPDADVLLLVISALSIHRQSSKDVNVLRRFQNAIERVGDKSDGMQEAFDDAKLRIMLGLDTKQIVKTSSAERCKQLAELNAKLGMN